MLGLLESAPRSFLDGPDLTRYFLVCGGLLLLVVALSLGFRRVFARALAARAARRSLRIVDALPLGRGKRLLVVSCYDRTFLVGEGDKELHALAELDAEALAAAGGDGPAGSARSADTPPTAAAPEPDFARELVGAGGPAVRPAPRRPVLDGGRGILG